MEAMVQRTSGRLALGLRARRLSSATFFCLATLLPSTSLALQELAGIAAIRTNGSNTCALSTGGGLRCWGDNGAGQVGDGTNTPRTLPVFVSGLSSGVSAFQMGSGHVCAIVAGGALKCWGTNIWGQIGDNTFVDRKAPVDVQGLSSGIQAAALGIRHSCALTTAGGVKCWGQNTLGQLGDNSGVQWREFPGDVPGLTSGVTAIAAGRDHTCAITSAGAVKCWGSNAAGQLGDNTTVQRNTPVDVSGLSSGVVAISGGEAHTCALRSGGGIQCWGSGTFGQLGDGSLSSRLVPTDVALGSVATSISSGAYHNCARTADGTAKCWGLNTQGQIGDSSITLRPVPVAVQGLTGTVQAVSAGAGQSCALMGDGRVRCWGDNSSGQLGDTLDAIEPAPVLGSVFPASPAGIGVGAGFTCVLTSSGGVKCVGINGWGQLGDGGAISSRSTLGDVSGVTSGVTALAVGSNHACVLTTAGSVQCWGYNQYGQLGDGTTTTRTTPVTVTGMSSGIASIQARRDHTCAITTGGEARCWGRNQFGQLGDGTVTTRLVPTTVSGFSSGTAAIALGDVNTCAITAAGAAKCWGEGGEGQLGNNTLTSSPVPVDVQGLTSGVLAMALGNVHACALLSGGAVKCWGWNAYGQVGDGTTSFSRNVPTQVSGLTSGVTRIAVGSAHSCAVTASGTVKCWGYNASGELGDGTTTLRTTPVETLALGGAATAIASRGHSCALVSNGTVRCWGVNTSGELGNGGIGYRSSPAPVLVAGPEQWVRKAPAPQILVRGATTFSNTPAAGQSTSFVSTLGAGIFKLVNDGTNVTVTPINNGLPGLRVRSVRGGLSALYAGLEDWGVYRSTDGGATWTSANGTGPGALGCTNVRNVNVRTGSEVWAATACRHNSGVYRSMDGGGTWTRLGASAYPDDTPANVLGFFDSVVVMGTTRDGIFRSADLGATWTRINNGLPQPDGPNLLSVFGVSFLSSSSEMITFVEGHGVYRTVDGGASWTPSMAGLPSPLHSFAGVFVGSPSRLFIGTDKGGIYRSTDAGVTWAAWGTSATWGNTTRYARFPVDDRTGTGRYYVFGQEGLARTVDDGASFTSIPIADGHVASVVMDPNGTTAYAASNTLVRVSNLFAPSLSVTDIGAGLPGSVLNGTVDVDHTNPSTLYAAMPNYGVFKTTNGGASWSALGIPNFRVGSEPFVAISPTDSQTLYAGVPNRFSVATGGGVFKSTDGGTTWADSSSGLSNADARDIRSMATTPYAPSLLVIATEDGLYRSTDGGASWGRVLQVLDGFSKALPFSSVRFDPVDPSIAWAVATHVDSDNTVRASSGVWKSVDGGATWAQVLAGKRATHVRPESNGRVVVGLARDISQPAMLATEDGGLTWKDFSAGIVVNDTRALSRNRLHGPGARVVFASMSSGFYVLQPPAPDVSITSSPAAIVDSTSAVFTFSGTDPSGTGGVTFECSFDGGAFAACTSPMALSNLATGSHTLQVRATDGLGNTGTAVTFSWKVRMEPAISSTRSHTLALDADGKVYAWGNDSYGQLGQGRDIVRSTPTQVAGLPAVSQIALAAHALAIDTFKQVWSWGDNSCGGQLGPREASVTTKPSRVTGATNMTRVAAGPCYSLAVKSDGTVWGWGLVPGYGSNIGLRQLSGLSGIVDVAAGSTHALALKSDGTVFAFGDNSQGQLGLGTTGAAQAAIQVPGVSGASALAAGSDISLALRSGGEILLWGDRGDGTVISTPTATASTGAAPVAIAVADFVPHAARADGTIVKYTLPAATWQPVSGFSGITRLAASGHAFTIGIDGAGQVYASGSNQSGQLGQGSTDAVGGVVAVSGLNATMVVASSVTPSVLALKGDGSVWFWGADTVGQGGSGAAVNSSVPLSVTLPATIRQVATGDRFSVALDTNGNVWGWGDNGAGPFGASLVSRSTPAQIAGVSQVSAIAAGSSFVLYLKSDGTVVRSGTLAEVPGGVDPSMVTGLGGITAIAAGGSAYAVRNDGAILALGANGAGELGNGSTTASATPVLVNGISGVVGRLSAAGSRVSAVTTDGKVWSWGAAPLGNGSAIGSSTPVQVSGVTDAADVSVGSAATLVVRQNGALLAFGNTGLSDASGQNALTPYNVAFHEPVKAARLAAGHTLGYLTGANGLAWGFGFGNGSAANAAIGDGAYVARSRPGVVLAAGGAGSVDANNWYLDLDRSSVETIPASSIPTSLGVGRLFGSQSGLSFDATVKYKAADEGKKLNNYAFGLVPAEFFGLVKNAPGTPSIAELKRKAKNGFVLAQLTPAGWTNVSGQLIAYSQSTANAAGSALNILNGINAQLIPGARFCVGYGESSGSMLSFQALSEVLLLEGASSNASGVPCVLTGMYVDGPHSSRLGSSVTFKGSVVGLSPTGTVQFKDGATALLGPVTLARSNDAVASASISLSTLTLGTHSIGAIYAGDSQNAVVSAEIPVRHEVVPAAPGETRTALVGPSSSDAGSTVAFSATVTGDSPSGTVQFKDGSADLGEAVPVVGGAATLRTAALATGNHSITASYSGDSVNAASVSGALAHAVYAAIVTSVTLSAEPASVQTGQAVTLTATVTGSSPSGAVTFRDGGTVIGTGTLANGTATLTLDSLESGPHAITVEYAGDSNNQAVSSPAAFVTISVPGELNLNPTTHDFGGQSMRTTQSQAFVLFNTTSAAISVTSVAVSSGFVVTHDCPASLAVGLTCTARVAFTPTAEGAVSGTLTVVTGAGTRTATVTGTGEKSLVSHYYRSILRRAPDTGGKAYWEAEAVRLTGLGANVNEAWFAMAMGFYNSAEYLAFGRNATEYVRDLYNTFFNRVADDEGLAYWTGQVAAGMPREVVLVSYMFSAEFAGFAQGIFGNTAARAEVDTVVDFYRGLLARLPDSGGFNFWVAQFRTAQCQGASAVYEKVEAISSAYAGSPEYSARNRSNAEYVGDLYNAFLRRGGDLEGVKFWIGQLDSGAQTRDQLRKTFIGSAEFNARVNAIVAQGCLQ